MSESDENYPTRPGFDQPEGAASYSEEQTLPCVDLYSQPDRGSDASRYGSQEDPWKSGTYGAQPQDGGQYSHQQYATPPYQQSADYGSAPQQHPVEMTPYQQQQWGQYTYAPAEHPQATVVLVLALVGFAGVFVTPFIAWYLGSKAKGEIERGAPYSYLGSLKIGHIVGMVLSILTIVGISAYVLLVVLLVVGATAF